MGLGANLLGDLKKTANQVTGNIPKAILCVPDISKDKDLTVEQAIKNSDALRSGLIESGDGQGIMESREFCPTLKPKFHCHRQSGMNFVSVTENGVNSNNFT